MRKVKIIDCIEIMKQWDYKRNSAADIIANRVFYLKSRGTPIKNNSSLFVTYLP